MPSTNQPRTLAECEVLLRGHLAVLANPDSTKAQKSTTKNGRDYIKRRFPYLRTLRVEFPRPGLGLKLYID